MARCEKQIINKQYPLKVEVLDFFKNPSYRENFYCFNSLLIIIALLLCISVFTIKYMLFLFLLIPINIIILFYNKNKYLSEVEINTKSKKYKYKIKGAYFNYEKKGIGLLYSYIPLRPYIFFTDSFSIDKYGNVFIPVQYKTQENDTIYIDIQNENDIKAQYSEITDLETDKKLKREELKKFLKKTYFPEFKL